MDKFIITGGIPLFGDVEVSGAKNVALKILIASLLTDEEIIIHNVPLIRDVFSLIDLLKSIGIRVTIEGHTVIVKNGNTHSTTVPLDLGARLRTSSMVLGPLLARYGEAKVPNPGGCRLGARPIDRHIEGLMAMGASITYHSDDGYFYAHADKLHGTKFTFAKNTHTGTETLILAAVLAQGQTILNNAAQEVEVDDLITMLTHMGAKIKRTQPRQITIEGVKKMHGAEYTTMPDRNEEVTYAIAAAITGGSITVHHSACGTLGEFLRVYEVSGGMWKRIDNTTTEYKGNRVVHPVNIETAPYPGFMTDWQAPWAVYMTQADGVSSIHETVFESRFSYVKELKKMGARIEFFDPTVSNPESFYNFNWNDRKEGYHQGIKISGRTPLHNAVLQIDDIRAGASLVLAALIAPGESYIHGVELLDRGYENIELRLTDLGAKIKRVKEERL